MKLEPSWELYDILDTAVHNAVKAAEGYHGPKLPEGRKYCCEIHVDQMKELRRLATPAYVATHKFTGKCGATGAGYNGAAPALWQGVHMQVYRSKAHGKAGYNALARCLYADLLAKDPSMASWAADEIVDGYFYFEIDTDDECKPLTWKDREDPACARIF